MEIYEKKTVDMLNQDSVSILTEKFIDVDGETNKIGMKHRITYYNNEKDRARLSKEQPQNVVDAVMAIWGNE